jgi:hypothetical protein
MANENASKRFWLVVVKLAIVGSTYAYVQMTLPVLYSKSVVFYVSIITFALFALTPPASQPVPLLSSVSIMMDDALWKITKHFVFYLTPGFLTKPPPLPEAAAAAARARQEGSPMKLAIKFGVIVLVYVVCRLVAPKASATIMFHVLLVPPLVGGMFVIWYFASPMSEWLGYSEKMIEEKKLERTDWPRKNRNNRLDVRVEGKGYNSNGLHITITNQSRVSVKFVVPAGALFEASNPRKQNLILRDTVEVTVEAGATITHVFYGYCGNLDRGCPSGEYHCSPYIFRGSLVSQTEVWDVTNKYRR